MLIVGSEALKQHIDINRIPRDIDIIGTYDEVSDYVNTIVGGLKEARPFAKGKKYLFRKGDTIVEAEIAWPGSLAEEFLNLSHDGRYFRPGYATLIQLYTLKLSHRYLRNSPHFRKTMQDIQLMRDAGAEIQFHMLDWFRRRELETYDYGHPSLNVKKGDFFKGDGIDYVYDHDSIHKAMKHQEFPAYTYFKSGEVKVSKAMFDNMDYKLQLNSVLEESYVLALERSQIPYPDTAPKRSFLIALEKVCTSITSGWWREFAWEHYDDVLKMYNEKYVSKFWNGVRDGIVKEYNE